MRAARIYPRELRDRAGKLLLTFRGPMARELDRVGCVDGSACVWSMWKGYLERDRGRELAAWLEKQRIPLRMIHASGHATVRDLQRIVTALAPNRVVPVHSFAPDRFPEFFPRVESRPDGEWWEI